MSYGLRSLDGLLDISYDTRRNSLVDDFYLPCFKHSILYQRAVAYFTSRGLSIAAQGVSHLLDNDGKIQLICSPQLSAEDIAAIRRGYEGRLTEGILELLGKKFVDFLGDIEQERLNVLAWLISEGKMEVRLAIPKDLTSGEDKGIYHQKIGIFSDAFGNAVAFSGSSNETEGGLVINYESIDVFTSWQDSHRVDRKRKEFLELWDNEMPGLEVLEFTGAADERLRPYRKGRPIARKEQPQVAEEKWRHQQEAIAIFLEKEQGILNMATGTGKTKTSLAIVRQLIQQRKINSVIVVAYGTDLLDQWYQVILKELQSMIVLRHFEKYHEREKYYTSPQNKCLLISRSALAPVLKRLSPEHGHKCMIIHDEIHRMGSEANVRELAGLHQHLRFRLGLSATPDREYDAEGTRFIKEEIGEVIFEFGLGPAIERGILAPFDYVPLEYELLDEEKAELRSIIAADNARKKEGIVTSETELWQALAAVYKRSQAKIPLFREYVSEHPEILNRCVIFVYSMEYGKQVLEIVHEFHSRFHTYFASDDKANLEKFARGELECLLTCKKLSEGIDVPSMKNIILFSSDRSKLETIQRLGRCIRVDPKDPQKVAKVLDFVRVSKDAGKDEDDLENGGDTEEFQDADQVRSQFLKELSLIRQS